MAWLVLSSVLLAICVIALSFVTFSLARQIGVLHERSQPVASELRTVPVDEGAMLERLAIPEEHSVDTVSLLFVATGCPLCRMLHTTFSMLKEKHKALGAYWVFAGDKPESVGAYAAEHGIAAASVLVEAQLAVQCAVINTPTLVVLQRDNQGWQLQARRSITSSRQLQTLMDAYFVQAEKVGADYELGVRA
jgi:thiol-disulfide isomerase/thioredoxin